MARCDAERAGNCLGRHAGVFKAEGWVLHVTSAEAADLHYAKERIMAAKVKAFGTATPGRIRLWYFSLLCVGSKAARRRRAGIMTAYESYIDLLERLRTMALSRVSAD
jgi:hypothetical protein